MPTASRTIPDNLAGLRLDQALARLFPEYSRSRLTAWLKAGAIRVDGVSPRPRERILGGEEVGLAVGSLFAVTVFMAHCNLELNSKVIGWFFTTNRYHIHHHSMVREESNTNYGCACILWDRIFGTFSDADTKEAGIGKTQPTYGELFLMPFEEPGSSEVAPLAQPVAASTGDHD